VARTQERHQKNIFKDTSSINKIKSNIKRNLENYTHSIYYRNHGKKSVSTLLDHYPSQMDAIMVIVDKFTKMIRLKATTTNISSEDIANIYQDEIWKLHGIPKKILSGRRPQFASKFIKKIHKSTRNYKTTINSILSSNK